MICHAGRVRAPWAPAELGVWTDVTPGFSPALNAGGDDFGVQDVLVDPARPSDLYAFVCQRGVWKSTDYGTTWARISTGTNSTRFDEGKPWTAAINMDAARNPATPPWIITCAGNSSPFGFLRSTDGGVNWSAITVPTTSQDVYSVDANPYNPSHLIATFHDTNQVLESTDAGLTWAEVTGTPSVGVSPYIFFIDTGNAGTTADTWLLVPQSGNGATVYRTTNGGGSWASVASFDHFHGCSQLANLGAGRAFIGAEGGIFETTDSGATWTQVDSTNENGCVATPNAVYSSFGWASADGWDALNLKRRALPSGSWTDQSPPAGLPQVNGWKRAAVTQFLGRYAVVSGNWCAGIWRFVEA